ncbi:MAG TPA: alpha-glucan family phosphorylase [Frankiaceae bacterium]|nr:alpha-glucan family phosphorylase [Frankiaceae bacterium]
MRALRRFTVRARLPEPLTPLSELVLNLRWSWHPETLDLFESIDPELWQKVRGDPNRLLGEVAPQRLEALATDRRFLRRLRDASDELQEYLTSDRWYQTLSGQTETVAPRCIAYFSPEFGITESLPQYSGGLGILAGDHLKAASDLAVPIVGVGLLYRAGYFVQSLSRDGWQQEHYPGLDPHGLPLTQLRDQNGALVRVTVGLPAGRSMHAQVWLAQVGRVPLLLLDTDVEENDQGARGVTDRLYGGGSDHRLLQEMLLGIGGVRALRAWSAATGSPEPEVFHTNEGHAGFLGLERIRELVSSGLSFNEALSVARAGTVFTTHTPVPAGIDRFPRDLIERHFGGDNAAVGVPIDRILALGAEQDPHMFNMAHMGLRLAQRANGVSKLHGEVSRGMFNDLWPGFDAAEVPISSITNGVHAPTWVAREVMATAEKQHGSQLTPAAFEVAGKLSDATVWKLRRQLRERLVGEVRRRLRASWLQRGAATAELDWIDDVFDPDVLTIGFARRVPSYKRLTLMLRDQDRLRRMLLDPERPIQIVIAGKSHPADDGGKELIQQMVRFADGEDVRHRMVFLPDYDIGMAQYLYAGCDVWLNNPLRPLEACGTSGMKSALNGGLNLSIRDGWWDELFDGQNGWSIPTADGVSDPMRRDDIEATGLYELVEGTVAPRFYEKPLPRRWISMVKHTLQTLGPEVLATRMVRDYVTELYSPAAHASREVGGDHGDHTAAKDLTAWRERVLRAWPAVSVAHVESSGADGDLDAVPQVGTDLAVRAIVNLGGLSPDEVEVQACYGRVDETDSLHETTALALTHVGDAEEGGHRYEGAVPLARTGAFGYAVRVLPKHPLLATSAELGLVAVPLQPSDGLPPTAWV